MGFIALIIMIVAYMTIGLTNTLLVAASGALAYHAFKLYKGSAPVGGYGMVG